MPSTLLQDKASRQLLISLMQKASRMMRITNFTSQISEATAFLLVETEWNGYNNIGEGQSSL